MKKSILALSVLTIGLVSCKKDIEQKSISANDMTGTGYLIGNIRKPVLVAALNGAPANIQMGTLPASGVNVTVRVNKGGFGGLYPSSNMQGTDVYTGTTDANGNYKIAIKSSGTSNGVTAQWVYEGYSATMDTLVNNTVKTGYLNYYLGNNGQAQVYVGQSTNNGQWTYNTTQITNNPGTNVTQGTAIISGSVNVEFIRSVKISTNTPVNTTSLVPAEGAKVWVNLTYDYVTLSPKRYEATTAANGTYSITLNTVNSGIAGFNQNYTVGVLDLRKTMDTLKFTAPSGTVTPTPAGTVTGRPGVWNYNNRTGSGLYNNEIRNNESFLSNGPFAGQFNFIAD